MSLCVISVFLIVHFSVHFAQAHPFAGEFHAGWEGAVQLPQQIGEKDFLSSIYQLTFAGLRSGESYFSPDGKLMVFQSERESDNPFFQIYVMDLTHGGVHRVSPGIGKTTCAWIHPSKQKVLFSSTHHDPDALKKQEEEFERRKKGLPAKYVWDFDDQFELYETDMQGKGLKNLTNVPGYDAEASWSKDGSLIAFASNRNAFLHELSPEDKAMFEKDPSYMLDIFIMNSDGTHVRQLTSSKGYDGGPFFDSDGKHITWRRFSADGQTAEIYTMNVDGTDQRQLTKLDKMSWAPFYHPSGDYLIFSTSIHGHRNFELYLVDVEGKSEPVRVTYTDGFDGLPVFLPDGRHLAWTSVRGDGKKSQIIIANWNDAKAREALGLKVKKPDPADTAGAITEEDLRTHVEYLASRDLEGRGTGTAGERLATEYVAEMFEHLGLKPLGEGQSYFQEFDFVAGVSLGSNNALKFTEIKGAETALEPQLDKDWRPVSFSRSGSFSDEEIVFAGYGIVAPKSDKFSEYSSYTGLDVKDKWVLIFRFFPEQLCLEQRQYLNSFSKIWYKARIAREQGAKGLIVVNGPNSGFKEGLMDLKVDFSSSLGEFFAVSVTDDIGGKLIQGTGHSLKTLQDSLDQGESIIGFKLRPKCSGSIELNQDLKKGRNVIGRVASSKARPAAKLQQSKSLHHTLKLNVSSTESGESILMSAHVDHLGKTEAANGEAKIFYGADDNASGVAGLLEIAQFFASEFSKGNLASKRDILFGVWSGEELGLLGSSYYANLAEKAGALYPRIAAVFNLDMVGRLRENLSVQGAGSSSIWPSEIEAAAFGSGLSVIMQDSPYLPTDSTSFYLKGVPTLSAFTGSHEDYHTPSDTPDRLNYAGIRSSALYFSKIAASVMNRERAPDYVQLDMPGNGKTNLRAYIGTIPDYGSAGNQGVLLSGVKPNSPAEQAGIKAKDIVVSLAGQAIQNIYDYAYVLGALQIGKAVTIEIMRDGKRLVLSVIPIPKN